METIDMETAGAETIGMETTDEQAECVLDFLARRCGHWKARVVSDKATLKPKTLWLEFIDEGTEDKFGFILLDSTTFARIRFPKQWSRKDILGTLLEDKENVIVLGNDNEWKNVFRSQDSLESLLVETDLEIGKLWKKNG